MAKTLSFIIQDDAKYTRDLNANCIEYGYKETILDTVNGGFIPNPQSKKNFYESIMEKEFKRVSREQRRKDAINNLIIEE